MMQTNLKTNPWKLEEGQTVACFDETYTFVGYGRLIELQDRIAKIVFAGDGKLYETDPYYLEPRCISGSVMRGIMKEKSP